MCWACSAYGERRGEYRVLVGKLGLKGQFGDHGVDERLILKWIFRMWNLGVMDWIELAQDRDR